MHSNSKCIYKLKWKRKSQPPPRSSPPRTRKAPSKVRSKVKSNQAQKPRKRKMREVTDEKRERHYKELNRLIDFDTCRPEDLPLCVKESQLDICKRIIVKFKLSDVIYVNGLEDYETLQITLDISGQVSGAKQIEEKVFKTKLWHPITFAFFHLKEDFLSIFFKQMLVHLGHAIDINPGKFELDAADEGLYLGKGKMQGLLFPILKKNWQVFYFGWERTWRLMGGWHLYSAFRAFIEAEWAEGMEKFLQDRLTYKIMLAIPPKNRKDLLCNMKNYGYQKAHRLKMDFLIEDCLELLEQQISNYESSAKQSELTTPIFTAILNDDADALQTIFEENKLQEQCHFTGNYFKSQKIDISITYRSPVDLLIQTIRCDQFTPTSLALVHNKIKCLKYLTSPELDFNLFYCMAKPSAYEFSDTASLRSQAFPVIHAIINEHLEVFQYLYDRLYSSWRAEHLKHVLDELVENQNPTLVEYVLVNARTHNLFCYLSYVDRQLLIGYVLISKEHIPAEVYERHFLQRPYFGPYVFYIMSNLEILREKFKQEYAELITDEEIGEYIEGVSSNQALFMISELFNFEDAQGGIESIPGLEKLVDRVENHHTYF